MGKKSKMNPIS